MYTLLNSNECLIESMALQTKTTEITMSENKSGKKNQHHVKSKISARKYDAEKSHYKSNTPSDNLSNRAEDIKNTGKKIRDYAMQLTETLKAMREAGTFKEIGGAVHDSVLAAKTIMEEIDATVKELKQSGAINEIGSAVHKLSIIARQTGDVAHGIASKIVSERPIKKKSKKLVSKRNNPFKTMKSSSKQLM